MCYYCRFKCYNLSAVYQIQVPVNVPENTSGYHLYVNIGAYHLCFAVLNPTEMEFVALQHFNLEKHNSLGHSREIIERNEWLGKSYGRTEIIYNFSESILVPDKLYMPAISEASLELLYGDIHKGKQFSEHISEWEVYHIYRVPVALHDILSAHFTNPHFSHNYSCLLKRVKLQSNEGNEGKINVIFYNNKLIVSVLKEDGLQLLRSFEYETADDVVYYLLNICQQFNIDCEKVTLIISGLIADHSVMYAELQKYFMLLKLEERPADFTYGEAFDEYPSHFFTAIFNAALCG